MRENIEFASILVEHGHSGSGVFRSIGENFYRLAGITIMKYGYEGYTPEPNEIMPLGTGMFFANRDAIDNMIRGYILQQEST